MVQDEVCFVLGREKDGRVVLINEVGLIRIVDANSELSGSVFVTVRYKNSLRQQVCSVQVDAPSFIIRPNKELISHALQEILVAVTTTMPADKIAVASYPLSLEEFLNSPASVGYHSWEERMSGGLIIHTANVLVSAVQLMQLPTFANVDKDVVMAAILWHDVGKAYVYEINPVTGLARHVPEARLASHVSISYAVFCKAAEDIFASSPHVGDFCVAVSHCILASHARPEWGSVVKPQTPEAWLVHLADMLSTRAACSVKKLMEIKYVYPGFQISSSAKPTLPSPPSS